MEGLPEELMTLILSKLPVKTLLRCKCVRKSWYSLINSPQFIRLHRSSSSSPQFVIYRWADEEPHHVLSFYTYETLEDLGNTVNMPITHPEMGNLVDLCACDGLICITNHNVYEWLQILICNPAIREFRSLFIPPSLHNRSGYHVDSVAFAADPKTGEYKVVMIGVPYDNNHLYDPDIPDEDCFTFSPDQDSYDDREAKVYDFSTDSWRDTAVVIPAPFSYKHRPVSLNGSFHWWPISSPFPWDATILTFHISDEVTESIPLPDFVGAEQFATMELFVSSKSQLSLAVDVGGCYDVGRWFEIIVMAEYGVKESWTRLFQIGPMFDISFLLAFWNEQQLLLITSEQQLFSCDLQHQNHGEGQLVSYDLQHQNNQNHFRHFPIFGVQYMYPYSESLVSVNALR